MTETDLEKGLGARLLRNLTIQAGSQGIGIVLGLVSTGVLSRALRPEAFGAFLYLFTFIYFFLALNDLGINTILVREIAQTPSRTAELVQNILGFRLVAALASVLVGWVVTALLPIPPAYRLSVRVFLLLLPIQAFGLPAVILQAQLRVARGSLVEPVNRLTGFALMMLAVWMGHGLLMVTIALLCGEVAGAVAVIALTYRVVPPVPRFNIAVWRQVLHLSLPLSGTGLLGALLNKLDVFILQSLAGMTQVGFYLTAYKIPTVFERLPQLAMVTIFPIMSQLAATDPAALRRLYHRMLRTSAYLALPLLAGVTASAPLIVRVWFGTAYAPSVPLLRIVIWATTFLYFGISAGNLLIALGRLRANLFAMAAATSINLVLNILWIPSYGAVGAAWATVVAFAILCGAVLVLAEKALSEAVSRRVAV